MSLIATAFYQEDWFKAIVYVVIAIVVARVVDFILARRDRAMAKLLGKTPDRADRTRYIMIRRLVFVGILFVGVGIALVQIPAVSTLARAMLASAAIIAGVIGIAARAPIANLVSGIMIAFSQPVRLNDYISVDGEFGTVEQISLHLHVHPELGRSPSRHPQRGVRDEGGPQLLDGLAGQHGERRPRAAAGRRRRADVAEAMLEVGETLAPAPEGKQDNVEVADIGGGGVRLRLHAWAADPLRRRELASDLRAALLRRLRDDGLLGGGDADGHD